MSTVVPSSPTISVTGSLPSDISVDTLTPLEGETLVHDGYFWFDNVVFKAGNVAFKVVPQYSLPIEDPVFATLLKPAPGEKQTRGLTEDNPIVLPADVTPEDFRSLLKACNPKPNSRNAALTVDEWMSVLKLSKMWSLDSLRPKAIEESNKLVKSRPPLEKILLGKKYAVSKWLIEGYEALGKRNEMINDKERERLDTDTFVALVKLRERAAAAIMQDAISTTSGAAYKDGHARGENSTSKYTPATFRDKYNFKTAIKDIFAKELKKDKEYVA